MDEWIILAVVGAIGGLVRHILSFKGKFIMPSYNPTSKELSFGGLFNVVVGAILGYFAPVMFYFFTGLDFAKYNVPASLVVLAMRLIAWGTGYLGVDAIENLLDRILAFTKPRQSLTCPTCKSGSGPERIPI